MRLDRVVQRAVQLIVWGALGFIGVTALYASVWFWAAIW